jgi:hypothetical protein
VCEEFKKIDLVCQTELNLTMLSRATRWLKLRAGARKGADAKMVTQALDLARRRENRGNLGREAH